MMVTIRARPSCAFAVTRRSEGRLLPRTIDVATQLDLMFLISDDPAQISGTDCRRPAKLRQIEQDHLYDKGPDREPVKGVSP